MTNPAAQRPSFWAKSGFWCRRWPGSGDPGRAGWV